MEWNVTATTAQLRHWNPWPGCMTASPSQEISDKMCLRDACGFRAAAREPHASRKRVLSGTATNAVYSLTEERGTLKTGCE